MKIFEKHPLPWGKVRASKDRISFQGAAFAIVDANGFTVTPTKQFFNTVIDAVNTLPKPPESKE